MRQRSFGFQTIASEQTFMWRNNFNIRNLYWTPLNTFVAVLLLKLLHHHSSQLWNDRDHMWPLRSVVTSTHVQCRSLVIESARLNKPYRYGNKNLSKDKKKGIGAGWRHCPRPLNNDKSLSRTKPWTRMHLFFFNLSFLWRTFTNYRTAGEGGVHFFNSSLPLLPSSQTLRH